MAPPTQKSFLQRYPRLFLLCLVAIVWICHFHAAYLKTRSITLPQTPQAIALASADFHFLSSHCANVQSPTSLTYDSRFTFLSSALSESARLDGAIAYITEPGPTTFYYANVSSSTWPLSERPLLFAFVFSTRTDIPIPAPPSRTIVLTPAFELGRAKVAFEHIPASEGWEFLTWMEHEDPYRVLSRRLQALMSRPSQPVVLDDQMRLFIADGLKRVGLVDAPSHKTKKIRERKTVDEVEIMRCANEVIV